MCVCVCTGCIDMLPFENDEYDPVIGYYINRASAVVIIAGFINLILRPYGWIHYDMLLLLYSLFFVVHFYSGFDDRHLHFMTDVFIAHLVAYVVHKVNYAHYIPVTHPVPGVF